MGDEKILGDLAINGGEPVRTNPFGPRWIFGEEEKRHLSEVIDNAHYGWRNQFKVKAFTTAFAKKHGVKHAIAVNSGSGGCHVAVASLGLEPGDEVVTTPITHIGSVAGIVLQNSIPVFADMDPDTLNINPIDIERKITNRTRAILIVHLFGNPCDMDAIMEISRAHGIPVIEDCSQAHLARHQGRLVGTIGAIGVFSMGGKTLTTDQGGMIITDDDELADRMSEFARGGHHNRLTDANRFTDLGAAVGLAQFERWDAATKVRLRSASILDETVAHLPGFSLQKVRPGDVNSYYVYGYKIDEKKAGVSSVDFAEAVRAEGIPDCYGPYMDAEPLYRYPVFSEGNTYGESSYPFVDNGGNLRVDYSEVDLPNIESELPRTGFILFRNSYSDRDAHDVARAMRKVSDFFAQ